MITVRYSCPKCGLTDVEVQVPARDDPRPQAVVPWFEDVVARALILDHSERSPECQTANLKNVKVHVPPEAEFIGQQIE